LVGIAAGMVLELIIHAYHDAPILALFKAPVVVSFTDNEYLVEIDKAAVFSKFWKQKASCWLYLPVLK
jgi:hypothetical protein